MPTIEISEETFAKIKDQLGQDEYKEIDSLQDFVGQKVFIRTVTYHLLGKVKKVTGKLFEISDASWISDSGRFMNFIKEGKVDEVEPVGKVWVNTDTIVDIYPWKHELFKEQK